MSFQKAEHFEEMSSSCIYNYTRGSPPLADLVSPIGKTQYWRVMPTKVNYYAVLSHGGYEVVVSSWSACERKYDIRLFDEIYLVYTEYLVSTLYPHPHDLHCWSLTGVLRVS